MSQQESAEGQLIKSVKRKSLAPSADHGRLAQSTAPTQPIGLSQAAIQRAQADPRSLAPNDILQLQRSVGNQAVSQMLNAPEKPTLQRDTQDGFEAGKEFESQLSRSKGGGVPLPKQARESFESSFGANLSNVRIHTGGASDQLNRSIQAKAFTHGNDIHFGAGEYNPASSQGKHLLAHELTHTIQQTGGKQAQGVQPKLQVGAANDRYEREADRTAATISTSSTAAIFGHKGSAAGKVQPMAALAVQRALKFKPNELEVKAGEYGPPVAQNQKEKVSTGRKVANKLGYESNFQKIKNLLALYWQAHGSPDKQQMLLSKLAGVVEGYIKNQSRRKKKPVKRMGSGRDFKNKAVARLKAAIAVELPKLQKRVENPAFKAGIQNPLTPGISQLSDPMGAGKLVAHNRKHNTKNEMDYDNSIYGKSGWAGRIAEYRLSDPTGEKEFQDYKRYKDMGVNTADRIAIKTYTGGNFEKMNPASANDFNWYHNVLKNEKDGMLKQGIGLRGDYRTHDPHTDLDWVKERFELHQKLSAGTIAALNKLPNWKHNGKNLYRGETVSASDAANIAVGYERRFASFASTSQLRSTAEGFAGRNVTDERPWQVIYEVTESKTGKDVNELSNSQGELEVLFVPNTTFKVTAVLDRNSDKKILKVAVQQK